MAGWNPPKMDAETAEEFLRQLDAALEPAPKEMIVMLLARLAAHYWSERGETQWRIMYEDYAADLAEYPLDIVEQGIKGYRAKGKFWPKVSELLAEMKPLLSKRRVQRNRLAIIAGSCPEKADTSKPDYLDCLRRA